MKYLSYESAKKWAQSEANLYKSPQYVLQANGNDPERWTVASCFAVLFIKVKEYGHLSPVLTIFPEGATAQELDAYMPAMRRDAKLSGVESEL